MEKINNTIKVYVQIITFLLIWGIIILISKNDTSTTLWSAIKQIPQAIFFYVIIGAIFVKWLWRCNWLAGWLIKVPNLQGTWRGELKSDWVDPSTGNKIAPIQIILVIRQTFSNIKCTLMTKESTSYSTTADINYVPGGEDLYLTYNYTNRPKATLMDRSAIHDGAAILKIIKNPHLYLEGNYWTNRKTRGEITLKFDSKILDEKFK